MHFFIKFGGEIKKFKPEVGVIICMFIFDH